MSESVRKMDKFEAIIMSGRRVYRLGGDRRHEVRAPALSRAAHRQPCGIDARCVPGRASDAKAPPPSIPALTPSPAASPRAAISSDALRGPWTLDFGMIGCNDGQTRAGVAHVEPGRLFGGDSVFAYEGDWTLSGGDLTAVLDIQRHRGNAGTSTLFGTDEDHYRADFVAQLISPDLIEGAIRRSGFPDARLTMRRLPFRSR